MESVWIILIDISGSMDEGFSGTPSNDPLAERGRWHTKLDAAKDLLVRQVAASRVQDIAVFSFSDNARKLFHGSRSDFSQAEATIRALKTENRTNLANGFIAVTNDQNLEHYKALSVLVLSDGLSNSGDPVVAAEILIKKYPFARIDTILIDETDNGRRIAESVSINGSVRPAFSIIDLGKAIDAAKATSLHNELASFATRRLSLLSELSLIADVGTPTLLTVTSPVALTPAILRNDIIPTLEGLEYIENAACTVLHTPYNATINSISQDSPISISLTGFKEAVELALELVIPWRRKYAEQIAMQKLRENELENKKRELENHRCEVELANAKLDLAERMLATLDPNHKKSDKYRKQLLHQFIIGIDQMSKTTMEFKSAGPNYENDDRRYKN